jgi:hypothetical protein
MDTMVFQSDVGPIPYADPTTSTVEARWIRITYVKLGLSASQADAFAAYTNDHCHPRRQYPKRCPVCQFPHDITRNQDYTPEQFRAYRVLGSALGAEALRRTGWARSSGRER